MNHLLNTRRVQAASLTAEPYLLQPHAGARIDTTLAKPSGMAVSTPAAMPARATPATVHRIHQQPCQGPVCNFDAACPDHYCPGHPSNTGGQDPTDFDGLDALEHLGADGRAMQWFWGLFLAAIAAAVLWVCLALPAA